jgi:glycerophosphoryl diester phosphodiesterase
MNSQPRWPRVIGHRGAAKWAPENTLASFFCAADLGVEWVELDVRLCKGGIPVVFHDATLDRTTNGLGRVVEHRLDELRSLDAGKWFSPRFRDEPIPSLEEALAAIARLGMGVNVEIKPDPENAGETASQALAVIERVWPEESLPPLISSFSDEALETVRRHSPNWRIGLLAERFQPEYLSRALDLRAVSLNLQARGIEAAHLEAAHARGLAVLAYTVNDLQEARALWQMGVAGVFSDDPKAVRFS